MQPSTSTRSTPSDSPLPASFLWGAATAGHQIEGNSTTSDTWFLENVSPTIFRTPSGNACNSWELWETDLDMVAGLGLNSYRFSVEWARVEPEHGVFDEAALDRYEAMVDGCLTRGLAPVVTFNHFTSPHWFAMRSAWLDPEAPALFARYCTKVMERFGDRIAVAVTFNEPNLPELLTWVDLPAFIAGLERATLEAASTAAGVERYRAANVMLREDFAGMRAGMTAGHLAAKAVLKAARPDLPVGLSIAMTDDIAAPGGEELRDRKREEVYGHWLRLARGDDFIGVQNYERIHYGPDGALPPAADLPLNGMGSAIDPASLRGAVEYAYEVAQTPVIVTEHGVATGDDTLRAAFIRPSIDGLVDAVAEGVPVLGYFHWSLMDNFEWIAGYTSQLGLYEVNFETFERTAKPSAAEYADVVAGYRGQA